MKCLRATALLTVFTLLYASTLAAFAAPARAVTNPWKEAREPSKHTAAIHGSYAGGCLHGAVSLLGDQGDFHLMRLSRHRYYAHPRMRAFLRRFATTIRRDNLGVLLLGDISQPRGGPMLHGHASHQVGLDADVWFWLDALPTKRDLSTRDREQLSAMSMLNNQRSDIDRTRFGQAHVAVLKHAASDPDVQRIFVHARIKRALCHVTGKAAWLHKIRPWWGHHSHFHIRLHCPRGEPHCHAQAPVPPGPGCDQALAWWFTTAAADTLRERMEHARAKTAAQRLQDKLAKLPRQCADVLHAR